MKLLPILYMALAISLSACGTEGNTSSSENIPEPAPTVSNGQKLFVNNCVQCHNVKTDKIGPKLEGSLARWNNDTARIHAFIKNSQAVIKAGDPRAIEVYEQYNKTVMTPMTHLSDGEINEILEYVETAGE